MTTYTTPKHNKEVNIPEDFEEYLRKGGFDVPQYIADLLEAVDREIDDDLALKEK